MLLQNWDETKEFNICVTIACTAHLLFLIIIHYSPNITIHEIPYKSVRIKMGIESSVQSQEQLIANNFTQEELLEEPKEANLEQKPEILQESKKTKKTSNKTQKSNKIENDQANIIQEETETLRANPMRRSKKSTMKAKGSILGNSMDAGITIQNYEKILSLWILQYKQYPEYAKKNKHEGSGIVSITIDRKGKIFDYFLKQTTGFEELDHAIINMIKLANPVPIPPNEYPGDEFLYFLIPVKFYLS